MDACDESAAERLRGLSVRARGRCAFCDFCLSLSTCNAIKVCLTLCSVSPTRGGAVRGSTMTRGREGHPARKSPGRKKGGGGGGPAFCLEWKGKPNNQQQGSWILHPRPKAGGARPCRVLDEGAASSTRAAYFAVTPITDSQMGVCAQASLLGQTPLYKFLPPPSLPSSVFPVLPSSLFGHSAGKSTCCARSRNLSSYNRPSRSSSFSPSTCDVRVYSRTPLVPSSSPPPIVDGACLGGVSSTQRLVPWSFSELALTVISTAPRSTGSRAGTSLAR